MDSFIISFLCAHYVIIIYKVWVSFAYLKGIQMTAKFYFKFRIWKIFAKLQLIFELCKYFWRKMQIFVKFLQIWHLKSIFEVFWSLLLRKKKTLTYKMRELLEG